MDRTIAIKILPESLAADVQFRERFDREARTISRLDHPHICALYDIGEDRGTALHNAHRAGIVHRDLKPGNVMLTTSGARLLDFGLAKTTAPFIVAPGGSIVPTPPNLTAQGMILGTFQYVAPEQIEGNADARTDIFAFGCLGPDERLMAASMTASLDGQTLDVGAPMPLFPTRLASGTGIGSGRSQYAVRSDGRFLLNTVIDKPSASTITVVLNWTARTGQ